MANSDYSKAGDLLGKMMDMMGAGGGSEIAKLFSAWQGIVGGDIASHSGVEDIRNGTVIILVDHPAWLQQIQFRQKKFLRDLQKTFPTLEIQRMVCKIGNPTIRSTPLTEAKTQPRHKPITPPPEEAPETAPTPPTTQAEPASPQPDAANPEKSDFLASMDRLKRTLKDT